MSSTDRSVLLETPGLPVSQGSEVTLYCKAEESFSNHTFDFYKDGRSIGSGSVGEMTIQSVSKSDEGFYECRIPGYGDSKGNWMAVDGEMNQSFKYINMLLQNRATLDATGLHFAYNHFHKEPKE